MEEPKCRFDAAYSEQTGFDLLTSRDFEAMKKLIKKWRIRWLHCAPPCGTSQQTRKVSYEAIAEQPGRFRHSQRPAMESCGG